MSETAAYDVYLTETPEDSGHPETVAELGTMTSQQAASDLCITLQPFLRDGVEAHFVSAGD